MTTYLYGTDIINHFDLPQEISNIKGSFKYRFFEPLEQIDEENLAAEKNLPDPRYVRLDWSGNKELVNSDGFKDILVHRENMFFPSDLNNGYSILVTEEEETSQRQDAYISDASTGSKLEYLLSTVASNEFTENLEKNISSNKKIQIPVLDTTSNVPIQSSSVYKNSNQPSDIFVKNTLVKNILNCSNISPLSSATYENLLESADIISSESIEKEKKRDSKRLLSTLQYAIEKLSHPSADNQTQKAKLISVPRKGPEYLLNWSLIGYCISKYRIVDGQPSYMYSRTVFGRFYRDPHVAYGKKYKYEIRPLYAKYRTNASDEVIILGSDESANIEIDCVELRSPSPPKNLKFEYVLNSNIKIEWSRPESYVEDENQAWDTDDIKGYQIFIRNSLKEPYHLYRYFTFNNTYPRSAVMYASELISDDYVISSEYDFPDSIDTSSVPNFYEYREYTVNIRPNTDYYFAMCSIDAHGNSSNYSSQYKVRRNNVTGDVDIDLLCPSGAPKQYPNLLIKGKLVSSSMKSSGYQYLDVYFAPDTMLSVPNVGVPSVNIQMFELETQVEKNITITIKEKPKTAN